MNKHGFQRKRSSVSSKVPNTTSQDGESAKLWLDFVVSVRFTARPVCVKMATRGRLRVAEISQYFFCKISIVAHIPRVANISENFQYILSRNYLVITSYCKESSMYNVK